MLEKLKIATATEVDLSSVAERARNEVVASKGRSFLSGTNWGAAREACLACGEPVEGVCPSRRWQTLATYLPCVEHTKRQDPVEGNLASRLSLKATVGLARAQRYLLSSTRCGSEPCRT